MGVFNVATWKPPTSIVNMYSAGGVISAVSLVLLYGKVVLSGALTATVYKEMLAVSGSGCISQCVVYAVDTTSRTMGLKLVIDGVTVFDATSATCTAANAGISALGSGSTLQPVFFNTSLSISIKSSLSETNKISVGYLYNV